MTFNFGSQALAKYVLMDSAPVQPINFNHKVHAGDNEIPCRYCHIYASKSRVSGVPSVQRCMGCHREIRKDSKEIKKIHKHWDEQTPIEWVRVYDLPDYIYFPHNIHVNGGVNCKDCHGDVKNMARITRAKDLVMGWCISCHRERNGSLDCWVCHI